MCVNIKELKLKCMLNIFCITQLFELFVSFLPCYTIVTKVERTFIGDIYDC